MPRPPVYKALYTNTYQSEGVSSERDIWSLCVFACWWLWGMAVVGSSPSASFHASATRRFLINKKHLVVPAQNDADGDTDDDDDEPTTATPHSHQQANMHRDQISRSEDTPSL